MKSFNLQLFAIAALLLVTSCNGGKNKTNIELVTAMMDQQSVKFQDWDPNTKGNLAMRVPPANTVPRGFKPYAFVGQPEQAGQALKNPMGSDFSKETLELGKLKYDIYCGLCHGGTGAGDGQIAGKMILKPPPLVSDKVKAFPDGRIFHIITDGQGVMGSYINQVQDEKARWAIVNYVRTLQKRAAAN